jgi:hypothetical protein
MDVEQARKMARIKATEAAPVWGLNPKEISRQCNRGEIPGAVKLKQIWYVTPQGMDKLFEPVKKRAARP